ncbi:MAG: DUF1993 domain-containing protein [Alphaproteobacteria bacterium]|nr:DUF1993 domain-containing protein [Alphaproteobacteria bacterium]
MSTESFNMYRASIPVLLRHLSNLSAVLEKAAADAEARKIDPAVFINARLAPDMYPLARQIQLVSDSAKGCGARLGGLDVPSFADTETTFAELQERIAKTAAFLKTVSEDVVNQSAARTVTIKLPNREINLIGMDYLLDFVLPNFFFHITTAYAILRHNGVELGKRDFMGA